jgi:acetyl esterase
MDGMGLPLRTRLFWATVARLGGRSMLQTPAEQIPQVRAARRRALRLPLAWLIIGRVPRGVQITDERAGIENGVSLDVRIYRPKRSDGRALPLIVNFHGGGWVGGDARQSEWWCASLACDVPAVVVSVEYRLAPEHRFPIPAEDCYAATSWAVDAAARLGADPQRVAVMGDSAGGNLATVVCLMARDRNGPLLTFQLLMYPAVELVRDFPSAFSNANAPILTKKDMDNAPGLYCLSRTDMIHPYASPLRADLSGLPPALVLTAEFDPLRDQGAAYVDALRAAGTPAELIDYRDSIHGFISVPGVSPRAKQARTNAVRALRAALAGGTASSATVQESPALE